MFQAQSLELNLVPQNKLRPFGRLFGNHEVVWYVYS